MFWTGHNDIYYYFFLTDYITSGVSWKLHIQIAGPDRSRGENLHRCALQKYTWNFSQVQYVQEVVTHFI